MIRTLRAYFLSRLLREKVLLLGFLAIGLLWWLSSVSGRTTKFWREKRAVTSELSVQQQWLDRKVVIEAGAKKAASRLDPAQTLDRGKLVTEVNKAAAEVGLKNGNSTNITSEPSDRFTIHSMDYQIRDADYETLEKFYLKLNQRAPYIGIERFILLPTSLNDSSKLTLNLRITSVETPQ
jgi:hypothetical protein